LSPIFEPTRYLRPFPAAADVFANPVEKYARHLTPLLSIDLSALNAAWQGWIHLVNPFEPDQRFIGSCTRAFHNYYLRENWLAFRCVDNRYSLLGDFRFFQLENLRTDPSAKEDYKGQRTELPAHYARQQASLETRRERFLRHGGLYRRAASTYAAKDRSPLLSQLGGSAPGGNWSAVTDFPIDSPDGDDPRPLTEDGRKFHFIACVPAYNYFDGGADDILLFYDPPSQTALFTFEWT
jgi:hypothetical protein